MEHRDSTDSSYMTLNYVFYVKPKIPLDETRAVKKNLYLPAKKRDGKKIFQTVSRAIFELCYRYLSINIFEYIQIFTFVLAGLY